MIKVPHLQRTLHEQPGSGIYMTNSLQHSPYWEANSSMVSNEINHISWNAVVHYHVHNGLSLIPVLSQMNLVQALLSYFCNLSLNILPSTF
jgi:hypothetical protein